MKRPSIEALLSTPVVSAKLAKLEHGHASLQNTNNSNKSDLKVWEAELRALERKLEQKKKDLDSKHINGHTLLSRSVYRARFN